MDQETFKKEASADAGRAESPSPAGRPVHEPGGPSAEGDRIAGQAPANASTNGQAAFSGENAGKFVSEALVLAEHIAYLAAADAYVARRYVGISADVL